MNTHDPRAEKQVVLIALAEQAERAIAGEMLRNRGWSLEIADDGAAALHIFKRARPDLVIVDAALAGIDGYEVCAEIRKHPEGKRTPVLIVINPAIPEANCAYEAGATDFVVKPVEMDFLALRIRHIWREVHAGREKSGACNAVDPAFLNASPHLLLHVREDGTVTGCNCPESFNHAFFPDGLLGKKITETLFREAPNVIEKYLDEVLKTGEKQVIEHRIGNGSEEYFYESSILPGEGNGFVTVVRDVTEKKKAERKITRLAFHDNLTGLLNGHSFEEHVAEAIAQADHSGGLFAILQIDLDHFKRINRSLGHAMGDILLQRIADRIVQCTRRSDARARFGQDQAVKIVARTGGDEFRTLSTDVAHIRDVAANAMRLIDEISRPLMIGDREIFITASIGIAIYPSDGKDPRMLLHKVDEATYRAREEGGNNFRFYTESGGSGSKLKLDCESDLRRALDRGEFFVQYQPQAELKTGRIVGMEALLRWENSRLGLVPPTEFIPVAEESGLILPIGRWVMAVACMQNNIWRQSGFDPIRVSVNISAHQFRQKNLLETIRKALRNSALDPSLLELEITESTIMQNASSTIRVLKEMKEMGLRLAIDDFGTGYSSLSYLKRFPLDVLKIDRSFIKDITTDPDDAAITKAIIRMAHSLNLEVIAEGVETEEQLNILREDNCDIIQGFLFSHPLSPDMLKGLLAEGKRL